MNLSRVAMVTRRQALFVDASTSIRSQVRDKAMFTDNKLCTSLLSICLSNPHKNLQEG